MSQPINVLLQTTIEPTENDWHIGRFSMLRDYLAWERQPMLRRRGEMILRRMEAALR